MKKLTFLILVVFALGCSEKETTTPKPPTPTTKCTTCTEQATQVKTTYCGTIDAVNVFKQTLIHDGAAMGQTWKCKDNQQ